MEDHLVGESLSYFFDGTETNLKRFLFHQNKNDYSFLSAQVLIPNKV